MIKTSRIFINLQVYNTIVLITIYNQINKNKLSATQVKIKLINIIYTSKLIHVSIESPLPQRL